MNRPVAFQFYPRDWLDFRVQRMSFAAQGAYMKLLCFIYADSATQCSIIDDNELIANALGTTVQHWVELRKEIQCPSDPILEEKDGQLLSARLKKVVAEQRKHRRLQSEKGKLSGQARRNRCCTVVQPTHQPNGNSSSSSSLQDRERGERHTVRSAAHDPEGFADFWAAYPKKEGRKACVHWWITHQPTAELLALMLAKIAEATQTKKWRDENGKFVPMPATWLNQERWTDELRAQPVPLARIEVEL